MPPTFLELLDGHRSDDAWRFTIPRALHGAFGGAFGGIVAAACIAAARDQAEGRTPMALDCRFLRSLPAGTARLEATTLAAGRSLTNVSVDVVGPDDRLCSRATVSFAAPEALTAEADMPGRPRDQQGETTPWREPPGVEIPIVRTLAPRGARTDDGFATVLDVPWDPDPARSAEAACIAADMCVGPPVAAVLTQRWVPHPNPDLSLRFAGTVAVAARELCGVGRLERVSDGLAVVTIEVTAGGELVAVGTSTSMLLEPK